MEVIIELTTVRSDWGDLPLYYALGASALFVIVFLGFTIGKFKWAEALLAGALITGIAYGITLIATASTLDSNAVKDNNTNTQIALAECGYGAMEKLANNTDWRGLKDKETVIVGTIMLDGKIIVVSDKGCEK